VPVNGIPLLDYAVLKLRKYGFDDIIINIHHFAKHIVKYVRQRKYENVKISFSDERKELLDTGGGLLKASSFFND